MVNKGYNWKTILVSLAIFLMVNNLSGQITLGGNLLIPMAGRKQSYKAFITITRAEIAIKCIEKIFQPFNEFKTPRYREIKVLAKEIDEIKILENEIFIMTKDSFYQRYRNIFHSVCWFIGIHNLSPIEEKKWAIIFIADNPADVGLMGKKLIKHLNRQSRK